jgi:hypothetical protein
MAESSQVASYEMTSSNALAQGIRTSLGYLGYFGMTGR